MRFEVAPIPKHHEHKHVKRFAILPVRVQDEYIWLETYWTVDIYLADKYGGPAWRTDYRLLTKYTAAQLRDLLDLEEWPIDWRIDE